MNQVKRVPRSIAFRPPVDPSLSVSLYCLRFSVLAILFPVPFLWEKAHGRNAAQLRDKWRLFGAGNKDATIPYDFPSRCRFPAEIIFSLDLRDYS